MVKEYTYLIVAEVGIYKISFENIKIEKNFYEDAEFISLLKGKVKEKLSLALQDYPINILNIVNLTKMKPIMEE